MDDVNKVHGGVTWNGAAHADERQWEIYAADSVQMRRILARILMHESGHLNGPNHHVKPNVSYGDYPYFKYLIVGSRRGCVRS